MFSYCLQCCVGLLFMLMCGFMSIIIVSLFVRVWPFEIPVERRFNQPRHSYRQVLKAFYVNVEFSALSSYSLDSIVGIFPFPTLTIFIVSRNDSSAHEQSSCIVQLILLLLLALPLSSPNSPWRGTARFLRMYNDNDLLMSVLTTGRFRKTSQCLHFLWSEVSSLCSLRT